MPTWVNTILEIIPQSANHLKDPVCPKAKGRGEDIRNVRTRGNTGVLQPMCQFASVLTIAQLNAG